MATYTVKAPDGKTITLQGPAGASHADIIAQAQRLYRPSAAPAAPAAPPPQRPAARPAPLPTTSTGGAFWRGLEDAIPGVNYLQAAANVAGTALGLNSTHMSYADRVRAFKQQRDQLEEADRQQHAGAHYTGEAGSLVLGGGAIGAGMKALRLARVAAPVANVLQHSRLARAAAMVASGAAGGAAYNAGDANPENAGPAAVSGAETGAVAAPMLGLGFKAAQVVTRPFRDVLRMTSAGRFLSRLTTATQDELQARADKYRARTGAEPTLFEILPLADRNKILKQAVVGRDNVVEAASTAIRNRANNLGPEMAARARTALAPQRGYIERGLMNDITTARGGTPLPTDPALVRRAAASPTDMSEFRDQEARAIMAPHETTPVAGSFNEILPQVPKNIKGTITMVDGDPEVTQAIRSAVPSGFRTTDRGVTAGDISDMIQTLRGDLGKGGIDGRTAQRAIDHLQDVLGTSAPEAAAAHAQMTDAYAARSRMMEGMQEGSSTRLRDEVQVGTSRRQARTVRNAYDTSEGATGRTLGQSNRVLSSLEGSPEEALRATVGMSRNSTGRQLAQNIGQAPADDIMAAARAQDESAQALSAASNKAQGGGGETADPEMLVQALVGLHPSSFMTTKIGAMRKLVDMTYIPENRARTIVDMVFSQDPAMMQKALNAIGNEPNGAQFLRYLTGAAGVGSASGNTPPQPQQDAPPAPAAEPEAAPAPDAATPTVEPDASPYAMNLQQIQQTENPDLLALIDRQFGQESGNRQFGPDGKPLTSPKGAVGQAQVMPHTAPEAAADAGLPWDENAYQNDATYNRLLGIGYMSKLLRKHNGDVARALAAYNAGPDRVDHALASGDDWLSRLPAETQDYVQRVM